jgi:hypothetical protein
MKEREREGRVLGEGIEDKNRPFLFSLFLFPPFPAPPPPPPSRFFLYQESKGGEGAKGGPEGTLEVKKGRTLWKNKWEKLQTNEIKI